MKNSLVIKDLLGNIGLETFLKNYMGKRPLFIKNAIKKSKLPLNKTKFEKSIDTELEWNWTAMKDIPDLEVFKRDRKGVPYLEHLKPQEVRTLRESGFYLVVNEIEKTSHEIATLLYSIENDLGIFTTRYLANLFQCSKEIGLGLHNDPGDIFTLQLEGKKKWIIGNTPFPVKTVVVRYEDKGYFITSNHQEGKIITNAEACQSFSEIVVEPGDFLYLPAFCLHETKSLSAYTLSLNILRENPTTLGIARYLISSDKSLNYTESEKPLGPKSTPKDAKKILNEEFSRIAQFLENQTDQFFEYLPSLASAVPSIKTNLKKPRNIKTENITLKTKLSRNLLLGCKLIRTNLDGKLVVKILLDHEELVFDKKKWQLVPTYLMKNDSFTVREMISACKLDVKRDWNTIHEFFTSLIQSGSYHIDRPSKTLSKTIKLAG